MKIRIFLCLLIFGVQAYADECGTPAPAPDQAALEATQKLIAEFIYHGVPYPGKWTDKLQTEEIDFNALTGSKYEDGRAYAAIAYQKIKFPFAEAVKHVSDPGLALKMVNAVKTLRFGKKLGAGTDDEFCFETAIKVPVVSDFQTHVKVRLFRKTNEQLVLEWKQIDDFGDLSYNHGISILEPDGENSKLSVIGIHIIRQWRKVPWLGRGTARSFAKRHYGHFVEAFQQILLQLGAQHSK